MFQGNLPVEPSNISDSAILIKSTHSQSKLIEWISEGCENQKWINANRFWLCNTSLTEMFFFPPKKIIFALFYYNGLLKGDARIMSILRGNNRIRGQFVMRLRYVFALILSVHIHGEIDVLVCWKLWEGSRRRWTGRAGYWKLDNFHGRYIVPNNMVFSVASMEAKSQLDTS